MKKLIIIPILIVHHFLFAQNFLVSGIVTDESGQGVPGVNVIEKGTTNGTTTDIDGKYSLQVSTPKPVLVFSFIGLETKEVKVGGNSTLDVQLSNDVQSLSEVVVTGLAGRISGVSISKGRRKNRNKSSIKIRGVSTLNYSTQNQNETYNTIDQNSFVSVNGKPRSTFSIDVDKAAYANIRRMINNGNQPPGDAVKIEEMINYFDYEYADPVKGEPFSINTELAICPWNDKHKLMQIGIKGKSMDQMDVPTSNLVFLLDVSGSMNSQNKLPLLKSSLKLLLNQLREDDRVAIVVYAGSAGLVLPSTSASNKSKILKAIDNLSAGGSTAGGAGIELAYKVAKRNFIIGGNNRVILGTDGDFNVGISKTGGLKDLIKEKAKSGIYLTCLGFGMGNYRDDMLETLAHSGNGNHAYIDSMQEAYLVLGKEFAGTVFAIAKDVKIQVEFNPSVVAAYRLIGYESRLLEDEDFKDDKKDAGELGAGHTVTALYEIIPVGVKSKYIKEVEELKYQKNDAVGLEDEMATTRIRYKPIHANKSKELVRVVSNSEREWLDCSSDFQFASSVALFGMLLSDSKYVADGDYNLVSEMAKNSKGKDSEGYRGEFIRLVGTAMMGF
ncbi:MAG: von Willebrand factor type A domain-containing protein [bacterium]|nr:von Willebrand factor type A domain-containing protein [bacterium]